MANILIDIGHPAHVHLFRNAAALWRQQGHNVLITALDREIILNLLDAYQLPYQVTYRRRRSGTLARLHELVFRTFQTYRLARGFDADLLVSFGNPTVGAPAWLLGKPYIAFTDTETAPEQHRLFKPFATVIATPTIFMLDMGPRQQRYNGYHELAYLHPDYFTPDPAMLQPLGLSPDDTYFVMRLSAWKATHDTGQHGFTPDERRAMIRELAAHGRVFVSAEAGMPPDIAALVETFPPGIAHHLLAFATMYVGEGITMLSEAAQLGVPAVLVNTMNPGYTLDLQNQYELVYIFHDGTPALAKVRELLAMPDLRAEWTQRRARMLAEKISPTPWLVDLGNRLLAERKK